jgi:hypothetical protein
MAVPNIFATASAAIPLSQLDQNFATAITLGNTAVYLGNTTTSLGNVTLTNTQVNNYTEGFLAVGNTSTAQTISLNAATVQSFTLTANCTFTMPTATAGKSFMVIINSGAGNLTGTFSSVKWPANTAPTITTTASRYDIITFVADGSSWFGSAVQNYT